MTGHLNVKRNPVYTKILTPSLLVGDVELNNYSLTVCQHVHAVKSGSCPS